MMSDQTEFSLSRPSLPEKDLAYIAGLFDGEGSVSVIKHKAYYSLHVAIAMLEQEPLLLCARLFGGHVIVKKQRTGYANLWMWSLSSQKALHFLKAIRPYLLGKGQQVDIAITFQEAYWEPLYFRAGRPLPSRSVDAGEKARAQLSQLRHSRGKRGKAPWPGMRQQSELFSQPLSIS